MAENTFKLQPKYLTINFNFEMTASVVTKSESEFSVQGHFRTTNDLSGLIWETEDTHSHSALKYKTDPDFSDVVLSYDYSIEGYTELLDSTAASALTVETNDGATHYVRLWNYVKNRPLEAWEEAAGSFPVGRNIGNATGASGTIELNFNELYEGWRPYEFDEKEGWVSNPDWKKINVKNINKIMWSFTPKGYTGNGGNKEYLEKSYSYKMHVTNWRVTGNKNLETKNVNHPYTPIRMCDDYDDVYNLTPERIVDSYLNLGYRDMVTFYIGASHYYDKTIVDGKGVLIENDLFNSAFLEWYKDYISRLSKNNINIIHSISMENVDAPSDWWQRTYDGRPGTSGWTPTPHLLSFTNKHVQAFYKKLAVGLAKLSEGAGLSPIVQLGEPWWWFQEESEEKSPCFYDDATKQQYLEAFGESLPEFKSINDDISGNEKALQWLQNKNGEFTLLLRDAVKEAYSNAQFTVLFFPPSVMDKSRATMMMGMVNFPKVQWAYPNLDFFMLEDYDYLIFNQIRNHREVLNFVQNNLGYPSDKIHYFAGFVLDKDHSKVWKNIDQAIIDGFNQPMGHTYIWAYAQVKRDNWTQPHIIFASRKSGNYSGPFNVSFQSDADEMIYTTDGSDPTLSGGKTYSGELLIDKTTDVRIACVNNGITETSVKFSYSIPMAKSLPIEITATGNFSEWTDVESLAIGSGKLFDLSAAEDDTNLYLYVRGYELDTSSNFYIDTGLGTGYRVWAWSDAQMDFMIQNDKLLKYVGNGDDFTWQEVSSVSIRKTNGSVEVKTSLKALSLSEPRELKVGFGRNFEDFVPIPGRNAARVNTLIMGTEKLNAEKEKIAKEELLKIYKSVGVDTIDFEWEKPFRVEPAPNYIFYLTPHMGFSADEDGHEHVLKIEIKNGKADLSAINKQITDSFMEFNNYLHGGYTSFETLINKLSPKVGKGFLTVKLSTKEGLVGTKVSFTSSKKTKLDEGEIESTFGLDIEMYTRPIINTPVPDPGYEKLVNDIENGYSPSPTTIIAVLTVSAGAIALILFGGEVIAAVGAAIVGIGTAVVSAAEALGVLVTTTSGMIEQIVAS
ncbi:chitobiase/beta-hexosaminidase C-terminal domain-containing protein [Lacticaseibacillus saniviri]